MLVKKRKERVRSIGEHLCLLKKEEADVVVAWKDGPGQSEILIAFSGWRSVGGYE